MELNASYIYNAMSNDDWDDDFMFVALCQVCFCILMITEVYPDQQLLQMNQRFLWFQHDFILPGKMTTSYLVKIVHTTFKYFYPALKC